MPWCWNWQTGRFQKPVFARAWEFESPPGHRCGRGGIGRRAALRGLYPQGCGGSSPLVRTKGHLAQLARAPRLHRGGRGFESLSAHFGLMPEGLSASTLLQEMKKISQKDRNWEPGSHEDPQNPGVYKKVLVRHEEADPDSKLMMFQLCKIPPKTTHVAHSHPTMGDFLFYR